MSSWTDGDAWTCPHDGCGQTVRGSSATRRHAQGTHARRHQVQRADLVAQAREIAESREPATPADLVIPAAPKTRRRQR